MFLILLGLELGVNCGITCNSRLKFLRNCQTVFQRGHSILHSDVIELPTHQDNYIQEKPNHILFESLPFGSPTLILNTIPLNLLPVMGMKGIKPTCLVWWKTSNIWNGLAFRGEKFHSPCTHSLICFFMHQKMLSSDDLLNVISPSPCLQRSHSLARKPSRWPLRRTLGVEFRQNWVGFISASLAG